MSFETKFNLGFTAFVVAIFLTVALVVINDDRLDHSRRARCIASGGQIVRVYPRQEWVCGRP